MSIQPARYISRPTETVEAWEIREDNIEQLARRHRLELVTYWHPRQPVDSAPVHALQSDLQRVEIGGYVVKHADGRLNLLCQASFVARYMAAPAGLDIGYSYARSVVSGAQAAIDSLAGKTVTIDLIPPRDEDGDSGAMVAA